ncbi:MAG: copper chaperone PCu(A)C [Acidimicrobiales bacterium]|nr:copper chaperone PCu(A)C [Acidimicrobiales bacterium]
MPPSAVHPSRRRAVLLGALALLAGLAPSALACGDDGDVGTTAQDEGRPTVGVVSVIGSPLGGSEDAAATFTITGGDRDDRLVDAVVATDVADDATIGSVLFWDAVDENGDIYGGTEFEPVDAVDIPARTEVELSEWSEFVLLQGLAAPLEPGSVIAMTLRFEQAGDVEVDAIVLG